MLGLFSSSKELPYNHPSRQVRSFAVYGKDLEFPAFTTYPQQDHRESEERIRIASVIDIRATPWNNVIRANLHKMEATSLPSLAASPQEVREFLYFILANQTWSKIPDDIPQEICSTLMVWKWNGKKLRQLDTIRKGRLCPPKWTDVYGYVHNISSWNRARIESRIRTVVGKLVKLEEIAQARTIVCEKEGAGAKVKSKGWKRFFCFGDEFDVIEDTASASSCSVRTSSLCDEKRALYT
ncbi:hypothetical protein BT63DRAFT_409485 [Microthyrium microscopicum]|uniref:Uncharacterized protein n=1 Tax=Microthyrium microscopicum TaxID=703497 RepID=A0A6A6UVF8_9PEZI|nr:hypothetical protein BT63DRAFT_409485 [Microthyrium microscopicum]